MAAACAGRSSTAGSSATRCTSSRSGGRPARGPATTTVPRPRVTPRTRRGGGASPAARARRASRPARRRCAAGEDAAPGAARRPRQRHRANAGDGMEQLEQIRRSRHRRRCARDGRRDGEQRHARRGLRVRQHRRHVGGRQARLARQHHEQQQVPRHEGARRLRPLQGAQARDLFVARAHDVRRLHRQLRPRGAGREDLRRVGDRLPQVRLVRGAHAVSRRGHARTLSDHGRCLARHRTSDRLQPLPVWSAGRLEMGRRRRRQLVAHDGRHPRHLGVDGEHRLPPGRARALREARPLQRSRHARDRERRDDRRRSTART